MSTILASQPEASPRNHYRPREPNVIQRLFRERFAAFEAAYAERCAVSCGKYRLPLIQRAPESFRLCGDWREGIARVHCTDCGYDLFVPFSCKSFEIDIFRCPFCGGRMSVIAIIRDPQAIRGIIDCMNKKGRGPPALAPNSRN